MICVWLQCTLVFIISNVIWSITWTQQLCLAFVSAVRSYFWLCVCIKWNREIDGEMIALVNGSKQLTAQTQMCIYCNLESISIVISVSNSFLYFKAVFCLNVLQIARCQVIQFIPKNKLLHCDSLIPKQPIGWLISLAVAVDKTCTCTKHKMSITIGEEKWWPKNKKIWKFDSNKWKLISMIF